MASKRKVMSSSTSLWLPVVDEEENDEDEEDEEDVMLPVSAFDVSISFADLQPRHGPAVLVTREISLLLESHLASHGRPGFVPFLDLPGNTSMSTLFGEEGTLTVGYRLCGERIVTSSGPMGQVRIYYQSALGPFLAVEVIRATLGNTDVTEVIKSLLQDQRHKQQGLWLSLPRSLFPRPRDQARGHKQLVVSYNSMGKERRLEASGPGLCDLQLRACTDLPMYRSLLYGKSSAGAFDDTHIIMEHPTAYLVRLEAWFGAYMKGLQCFYRIPGQEAILPGPRHYASQGYYAYYGGIQEQHVVLELEEGELINQVTVRSGQIVDGLQISTTRGRVVHFGGMGGTHHELGIPVNHRVRCFFGGIDGILSRLGVVSTIAVTQAELDGFEEELMRSTDGMPGVLSGLVMCFIGYDIKVER